MLKVFFSIQKVQKQHVATTKIAVKRFGWDK